MTQKGITYMAIGQRIMDFFGLGEEYQEEAVSDPDHGHKQTYEASSNRTYQEKTMDIKNSSHIKLIEPRSFNEAQDIADCLAKNKSVVINIRLLDHKSTVRIIDFISGVTYALEGDIRRIDKDSFLCVPKPMNIQGIITDEFQ